MDAYNDIFGIKTCERQGYTRYIKNRRPFTKVGLAALSVTASVAFTYGIYTHAPNKSANPQTNAQKLEEIIK